MQAMKVTRMKRPQQMLLLVKFMMTLRLNPELRHLVGMLMWSGPLDGVGNSKLPGDSMWELHIPSPPKRTGHGRRCAAHAFARDTFSGIPPDPRGPACSSLCLSAELVQVADGRLRSFCCEALVAPAAADIVSPTSCIARSRARRRCRPRGSGGVVRGRSARAGCWALSDVALSAPSYLWQPWAFPEDASGGFASASGF